MKIFEKLDEINEKKTIKVKKLLELLGKESFFQILFVVTLITSIPAPSWGFGTSTIPGGILTLIIAVQLILDYKYIRVPDFIGEKDLDTSYFSGKYFKKIKESAIYLKTLGKPRLKNIFNNPTFNKIAGISLILPAILMIVPIIFTNMLPSMIVTGISLAYILKDGLLFFIFCLLSFIVFVAYIFFFKYLIIYLKYLSNKFIKTNYSY